MKNRFLALQKKAAKGGKARKPVAARARADEGHEGGAGPRPPGAALGRGKPGMTPMEGADAAYKLNERHIQCCSSPLAALLCL